MSISIEVYCYYGGSGQFSVFVDNKREVREWKTEKGKIIKRKVRYYECKNGVVIYAIRYKGKIIRVLANETLKD